METSRGTTDPGTPTYDAIVFDADGVLVGLTDRSELRGAIEEAFREFDVEPSQVDVDALVGAGVEDLQAIARRYDIDPGRLWSRREANASSVQRRAIREGRKALYPDVDAIERLAMPMAVVSNNQHETIDYLITRNGLERHFDAWYGREPTVAGIERMKPNPHYLRLAVRDLDASRPLYVGDSEVDMLAAARADVDGAFLRRSHRKGYELEVTPRFELETLAELTTILP